MNPSNPTGSHPTALPHSALQHTNDKPITQPTNLTKPHPSHSSMEDQAELLSFVENFTLSSPNFRRPSPRPSVRSRQVRNQWCKTNRLRVKERNCGTPRFIRCRSLS